MKDKNRIVIPTGHEPEEELGTPNFDAEETLLAARPVVPLTKEARATAERARAEEEFAAKPLTRRIPILALIIIAAVSVGLASGLAIGLYQGHQKAAAPVAAQPSTTTTATADTQLKQKSAPETTKQELPAVQTVAETEQKPGAPTALSEPEGDPMAQDSAETRDEATREASDKQKQERSIAPEKKEEGEKESPPSARKKPQPLRENDDGPKMRKLPRRRPSDDEDTDTVPRTVERANQELNRIREIFEGPRP